MRPRLAVLLTGAVAVAVATAVTGATVYRDRSGKGSGTGATGPGEAAPPGPDGGKDGNSGKDGRPVPGAGGARAGSGADVPRATADGALDGAGDGGSAGAATEPGGRKDAELGVKTGTEAVAGESGALRAWAELLRLPALFTVPGDALAGALASGTRINSGTALAIASSVCLYEAGMALNDWADRAEDAVDRPHRPLPSGRIRPSAALAASGALTAAGLALAAAAGRPARTVATSLAATVWAYDLALKHTPAGPVAMAAARGLDLLLGAAATGGRIRPALSSAATLGAHTLAVTAVSRHEAHGGSTGVPLGALAVTAGVAQTVMGGRGEGLHAVLHGGRGRGAPGADRGAVGGPDGGYVGGLDGAALRTPDRGAPRASDRGAPRSPGHAAAARPPGPGLPAGRREAASRGLPGLTSGVLGVPGVPGVPGGRGARGAPGIERGSRDLVAGAVCTVLGLGYAATAGRGLLHAALNPSPQLTQRAVGAGIRATIPLQAALAARAGGTWTALGIAALAPAARTFARKVSVT